LSFYLTFGEIEAKPNANLDSSPSVLRSKNTFFIWAQPTEGEIEGWLRTRSKQLRRDRSKTEC
jgi:hypothetical protein